MRYIELSRILGPLQLWKEVSPAVKSAFADEMATRILEKPALEQAFAWFVIGWNRALDEVSPDSGGDSNPN